MSRKFCVRYGRIYLVGDRMAFMMKPYFLPINKEYYLKLKSGEQDCEIRPADHRGWRSRNVYPGRQVLLSCGYGSHDRHVRTIQSTKEGSAGFAFMGIAQWHIDAAEKIYGKRDRWLVAFFYK